MANFAKNIPDSTFITNFFMEIGGKENVARVEAKADETFLKAVSSGRGAGLVSQVARDTQVHCVRQP